MQKRNAEKEKEKWKIEEENFKLAKKGRGPGFWNEVTADFDFRGQYISSHVCTWKPCKLAFRVCYPPLVVLFSFSCYWSYLYIVCILFSRIYYINIFTTWRRKLLSNDVPCMHAAQNLRKWNIMWYVRNLPSRMCLNLGTVVDFVHI